MKRINDVVVCESKRLDGLVEFIKRAQTAQLLLQAFKDPIQISVNKPQTCYLSDSPMFYPIACIFLTL